MMRIYMFHYVYDKNFPYHHFDIDLFEKFVKENKEQIIGLNEYIYNPNKNFDDKIILTFDDGTIDHYKNVFPILKKYSVTGVFSVCENIFNQTVLIVQKIHQLIIHLGIEKAFNKIVKLLNTLKVQYNNQIEDKEKFIKDLFQKQLKQSISQKIIEQLLNENSIIINFKDIYLSKNNIIEMQKHGAEFCYHTKTHQWLGRISKEEQKNEIVEIINKINKNNFLNILTFPFGDYNQETFNILDKLGIYFGLGINYNIIDIRVMTRLDCNLLMR